MRRAFARRDKDSVAKLLEEPGVLARVEDHNGEMPLHKLARFTIADDKVETFKLVREGRRDGCGRARRCVAMLCCCPHDAYLSHPRMTLVLDLYDTVVARTALHYATLDLRFPVREASAPTHDAPGGHCSEP